MYDNGVTYMFIQHSNVYLMVAARQNCNAASLLSFLHRVVDVRAAVIVFLSFFCYSSFFSYLNIELKEADSLSQ